MEFTTTGTQSLQSNSEVYISKLRPVIFSVSVLYDRWLQSSPDESEKQVVAVSRTWSIT